MAKEWAKSFYNSKAWQECRESYITYVFGLCERCDNPGYILHHKIHLTPNNISDPIISLNHDNLEYVCKRCHDEEHGVGRLVEITRDGLTFNEFGELIKEYTPPKKT